MPVLSLEWTSPSRRPHSCPYILEFVNVEQCRPVAVLFEVIAHDVLNDQFAVVKVCELHRVQKSVIRVR